MMLAASTCHKCWRDYDRAVDDKAYVVACPECGQNNSIKDAWLVTGKCACGKPIDDHIFSGQEIVHCP